MANDQFVYVTYIRTTPEKLWDALTDSQFQHLYWYGSRRQSTWKQGDDWQLLGPDSKLMDSGRVVEVDRPRRLVVSWRNEWSDEMRAEGYSRCTFEIEPVDDAVKLTVVHEIDKPKSKFIGAVSNGWPKILSSLKSYLETGEPLAMTTSRKP